MGPVSSSSTIREEEIVVINNISGSRAIYYYYLLSKTCLEEQVQLNDTGGLFNGHSRWPEKPSLV